MVNHGYSLRLQLRMAENLILRSVFLHMTKIKRKGYRAQVRLVVKMKVCLSNVMKSVEVNPVGRENFNY